MEEGIIWVIVIIGIVLIVLPFIFRFLIGVLIPGIYWLVAMCGLLLFFMLDHLFSTPLLPAAPWLLWYFWGALIGAALGFWTVAPRYGLRAQRPLIVASPFALMLLIAFIRMLFR